MNVGRFRIGAFLLAAAIAAGAARLGEIPQAEQQALDRISADSLKTNLTYLASDELQGRGTPSHGLDLAADYIADHFRMAGLGPASPNGSYFQTAEFDQVAPVLDKFRLTLTSRAGTLDISSDHVRVRTLRSVDLEKSPVRELPPNGIFPQVAGLIVAGEEPRYGSEEMLAELQARKPALILLIGRARSDRDDPEFLVEADTSDAPVIRIRDNYALSMLRNNRDLAVSVHVDEPVVKRVRLRNVAGILRGSDPVLRDQYVIVTAHYDHLGATPKGIFHGANDNASGTASVIEIAAALATLHPHPRRSILFMNFFGEEEGLLGSYYYTSHPLVPLKNTVANINLEQMGRTDEQTGREIDAFAFTGASFSDLPAAMTEAAKAEGINVYKTSDADDYFARSDNYAFALHGVIAHTVVVAFEFPDYHALGDTAKKIDYANMTKVDKGIAAGVIEIADEQNPPKWSDAKAATIYKEAGRD